MDPSRSLALCYNAFLRRGRRIRNSKSTCWATSLVVEDSTAKSSTIYSQTTTRSATCSRMITTQTMSGCKRRASLFGFKNPPHNHNNCHRQFSTLGKASGDGDGVGDSTTTTPWRVAIVGSGPSGCYTAKYLMAGALKSQEASSLSIDVVERLPTPYGLVRNGVAPDHPEVKNVQNDFDALFEGIETKKSGDGDDDDTTTAAANHQNNSIAFYGNVTVGGSNSNNDASFDVSLDELRAIYDVVVLAYGCESDRELDLPVDVLGEEEEEICVDDISNVRGILSAREFVNWYNGHPDYEWVTEQVGNVLRKKNNSSSSSRSSNTQNIVVIGHGNVAMDCARILAKSRDTLDPTDLTSRALDVLRPQSSNSDSNSSIHRSISVVGRRGHVQAAFTIKEVRELTKLLEEDDAQLIVRKDELDLGASTEASKEELKARPRARIHKLLEGHAKQQDQPQNGERDEPMSPPTTEVHLRFLTNPVRFQAEHETPDQLRLSSVVCERTKLEGEIPGAQSAIGTGSTETIDADLCLVSIGYKGLPIDDYTTESFDDKRGILENDHGRLVCSLKSPENELAPLYVSGWLKRGPSGIIGTNIGDAKDTVASILSDMKSGAIPKAQEPKSSPSTSPLTDLLKERNVRFVDWDAYRRIEDCESSEAKGENALEHKKRHPDQPREKIVDRETLLRAGNV